MTWDLSGMIGILIAAGLGLAIGFERELSGKAAGMRTYTLVCAGSALFTVLSHTAFPGADPARIAAQIVTGVGFLGAGLIIIKGGSVRGLTTAAGIWFIAAVGMASGAGLYLLAVAASVLYVAVVLGIKPLEDLMARRKASMHAPPSDDIDPSAEDRSS